MRKDRSEDRDLYKKSSLKKKERKIFICNWKVGHQVTTNVCQTLTFRVTSFFVLVTINPIQMFKMGTEISSLFYSEPQIRSDRSHNIGIESATDAMNSAKISFYTQGPKRIQKKAPVRGDAQYTVLVHDNSIDHNGLSNLDAINQEILHRHSFFY